MADKNERFIFRNRQVPEEYWSMTPEQKKQWVTKFLESFSPNDAVRDRTTKDEK
jgi:hypothetical protein